MLKVLTNLAGAARACSAEQQPHELGGATRCCQQQGLHKLREPKLSKATQGPSSFAALYWNSLGRQTQIPPSARWGARGRAEEAESPDPRSQPQTDR